MRIIDNPTQFRNNLRIKFKNVLLGPGCPDDVATLFASNIERGIYNFIIQKATRENIVKKWDNPFLVQVYLDHARSIFSNLQRSVVLNAVRTREIKAQDLPFMTHQELYPEKWAQLIEEKQIRMHQVRQSLEVLIGTRCNECSENIYEVGLDEGAVSPSEFASI
jgi:hypothetical protein